MRKLETALAVILAASAWPAVAAAQAADASASAGGGDQVQRVTENAFSRWDSNSNNRLEGDEFTSGLHDLWSGSNGELNDQAFNENWNNWFAADPPDFASLDEDGNDMLSQDELRVALNDSDLRGEWQGADDGYLTPEEFRAGVDVVYDRDQSGDLNQQESDQLIAVVGVLVPDQTNTAATGGQNTTQMNQATDQQNQQMAAVSQQDSAATGGSASNVQVGEIISLNDWDAEALYQSAWSAEALFDRQVFGETGEEIGDVEDLIVGSDGELLALVAEVGGFWDIGDTHVSVPWDQVVFQQDGSVVIPVTEENADDYSVLAIPTQEQVAQNVVSNLDDEELGPRAWRASELIGDIARIRGDGVEEAGNAGTVAQNRPMGHQGYGYVDDLIFNDGKIVAAVVDRDAGYGTRGRFAYPFYGYNYGWAPGNRYYDMPYNRDEATTVEPFDEDRLNAG
ncbi:PRC-barrel domain-containing protein [Rhizobium halophilum]|uniref:PRC-barrel domain-containing protein n=1 Tax=Rhizobium halophilum TaxID=2846852 RepID=UPI001EFE29A3|nr:PRC-barrel domain-containing protein [Rhizobium halophilum]MCF6370220.1 PRC-barrel domain-containing protein [Rhizobium halophilum]